MRKQLLLAVLPVTTFLASGVAQAASTADLIITGKITPASCALNLTGATINYGDLPTALLSKTDPTAITPNMSGSTPTDSLNITCQAPTQIGVKITDNRTGTADGSVLGSALSGTPSEIFGLGQDPASANIGAYTVTAVNAGAVVDGVAGKIITSTDSGSSWTDTATAAFSNDSAWRLSWTATGSPAALEPVTSVAQELNISAAVVGTDNLDVSAPVDLDGSMTIEMLYL